MDNWYSQIQSVLFTRLKYALCDASDAPFPGLNCTTGMLNADETEFPTLYLQTVGIREIGRDIDNTSVNAVSFTGQIQVISDEDEQVSLEIVNEAVSELKGMRFNINSLPIVYTENNIHIATIRFERKIGAQDEL